MIDKIKVIEYLKHLNEYERIKRTGSDKEVLIFKNRDEIFKLFGEESKEVLNPFNDYTYKWLNSFLYSVIDYINYNEHETYEELEEGIRDNLNEWVDSEVSVYTGDLTEWLHDNNSNVYYMEEAIKEYGETDGFKILQLAQYRAIDELYNNALSILIEDLKTEFEEIIEE